MVHIIKKPIYSEKNQSNHFRFENFSQQIITYTCSIINLHINIQSFYLLLNGTAGNFHRS